MRTELDDARFRQVLGQYPTGVVVVTAMSAAGEPLGMTVGSFSSVSLDPPLVAFMPDKSSSSWRALREAGGRFCVNVLGAHQEQVCRTIVTRKTDKFAGIGWSRSAAGNPVVDGAVAFIDCAVENIYDAGDHHIVVGRVQELDVLTTSYPLLFFRGGYGSFRPLSLAAGDADLLDQLRLVDMARPQMDKLAAFFDTEVTAITLVGDELVLAAAAGRAKTAVAPTRVGQRVPFVPPLGSVYPAWGSDAVRERWLANLDGETPPAQLDIFEKMPDRVRRRGFAMALGHHLGAHLETVSTRLSLGDPGVSATSLRAAIKTAASCYNPEDIDDPAHAASPPGYELRSLSAPVFKTGGDVAFTLTAWGPPGRIDRARLDVYIDHVLSAAAAATEAIRESAR